MRVLELKSRRGSSGGERCPVNPVQYRASQSKLQPTASSKLQLTVAHIAKFVFCQLVTYPLCYASIVDDVLRALSDGSRRTVLEELVKGEATAGELAALLPIARPGVSRHLRVLREAGLVEVRHEAQQRVYRLRPEPLAEIDDWLGRYRSLWEQRLNALNTEVVRGKKQRRSAK